MKPLGARQRGIVVLLATLLSVALTTRLGAWQLDRAAQKQAMRRAIDERGTLPPLESAALAHDATAAAAQHHRAVRLQGRWLAERTVYLDNRPMNGRAGFIVITPLLLEAGRETVIPAQAGIHPSRTAPDPGLRRDDNGAVIVQRGWIARDALQRTRLPDVATPAGVVNVQGSIAAPPSRLFEFSGPAETGPIRQNLDRVEYALETGLVLRPMSVLQADDSGSDGLLRQWPRPAFDVHKNYGYAAQWFALAALITGLYVWFQLVRPRLRARR